MEAPNADVNKTARAAIKENFIVAVRVISNCLECVWNVGNKLIVSYKRFQTVFISSFLKAAIHNDIGGRRRKITSLESPKSIYRSAITAYEIQQLGHRNGQATDWDLHVRNVRNIVGFNG